MKSKNGREYKRISKKDIPKWVLKKWVKIDMANHPLDINERKFYFRGKKYRYIIKPITGVIAQGVYDTKLQYFKRKRGIKK